MNTTTTREPLSDLQAKVLAYLVKCVQQEDRIPPMHVIAKDFGWSSSNSAALKLEALERKGYLTRTHYNALMLADRPGVVQFDPARYHLRSQIAVLAKLLGEAIDVVRNVEAEGGSEEDLLQALIKRADAAISQVTTEHLAIGVDLASGKDMHAVGLFSFGAAA
jgi:SOS-response transcriptional repressor LexA